MIAGPGAPPAGSVTSALVSHCTRFTAYFACEQVIDGKPAELILYVPAGPPGKFFTKMVMPNGLSTDRGEFTVEPSHPGHFTYLDKGLANGKPVYSRTENFIRSADSIHFEEYESTDNQTWTKTNEGDETRMSV